jgi:hypothetical protein
MPGTGRLDFDLIRSSPTGKMYMVELFPHGGKAQAQCIFRGSLNGTATHITLYAGPSLNDGMWHTITCTKTANQVTLTIATNDVVVGTWTAAIQIGTLTNRKNSVFALGYKPVPGGTDATSSTARCATPPSPSADLTDRSAEKHRSTRQLRA